jgi:hypothetical protein
MYSRAHGAEIDEPLEEFQGVIETQAADTRCAFLRKFIMLKAE